MTRLRTLTVLEHEVVPVLEVGPVQQGTAGDALAEAWLTEADAEALVRINDLRKGFCQRVSGGVKLAQHCGIVRLPSCVLEVLPKVGIRETRGVDEPAMARAALLAMLHEARQVSLTRVATAPQKVVQAPLLDIFIEAFLLAAGEQAKRSLLSRYVGHGDDLHVVKGRFSVHRHIKRNLARPHVLHCEFEDFTADNAYNRAIQATLDVCRHWIVTPATQRLWFEIHARFAGVAVMRMTASDVAMLPRDRTTKRYAEVLSWCEWLLSLSSPSLSTGMASAPGLLFDMNKLFEAFVSNLEERSVGNGYIVHRQGPVRALAASDGAEAFLLRPDMTVWTEGADGRDESIHRVVDAKWKRLDPGDAQWGVDQADVYQLLAYSVSYQCSRLELIFPQPEGLAATKPALPVFEIPALGLGSVKVHVRMVPLWEHR